MASGGPHPLDRRVPPPVVVAIVAAGMVSVTHATTPLAIPTVARLAISGGFVALAGTLGIGAVLAFRRARTTVDPIHLEKASALVTGGVYRWSRNPMYVAMICLLAALAVWRASPWAAIGPALCAWYLARFQIAPEERMMAVKFGEDYVRYCAEVPRWL